MKKLIKIAIIPALLIVSTLCAILLYLVVPMKPGPSSSMRFERFILLPRRSALTVFDYLTIVDRALFITVESSGSLLKVTLDANGRSVGSTSEEMRGNPATHGVASTPSHHVAFMSRSEENTVDVFDPVRLVRMERIPVAEDADAILYDPVHDLVYVASGSAKLATLIDPEKRITVGTIPLPGKPEFAALDPATNLLYQNLEDIDAVAAIDLARRSIVGQWTLAPCKGPSGMAMDTTSRRLFSVCSGNAMLVVFDLDLHRVICSMKIGGDPDSVAYDPTLHRIYSAGKSGKLTVIQQDGPDSYRVLDEISTHYGAHTLAVDPVSHKVFVAYASLFVEPRIAVFSPIN